MPTSAAKEQLVYMITAKSIVAAFTWLSSAVSAHNQVPPAILKAVEQQESGGKWLIVSSGGCVGVMQILPRYSRVPRSLLFIGPINRLEGARHLMGWYRSARGDWRRALAAYNCGYAGLGGKCGTGYAASVLRRAKIKE